MLDYSKIKEVQTTEPPQSRMPLTNKPPESSAEVQDLIATLHASYPDGLPPELQTKVDKIKKTSPMDLKKHIGQLTKVKKELDALREARCRHKNAWKHHVEQLVKNTKAQLSQYQNVIQDFNSCEDELVQQFQAARTAILQITQQSKPAEEDLQALNAMDASMLGGTPTAPINVEDDQSMVGDAESMEEASQLQQIQNTLTECVASMTSGRTRPRTGEDLDEPAAKTAKTGEASVAKKDL